MRVGYIGLGALGGELAKRFLAAHELTVWDLNAAAAPAFEALGARWATSPAELGRTCDVVLLCLPRSSDVREVLLGNGGLAQAMSAGRLVIDQTSGLPSATGEIAAQLAARGIGMVDAAVSANPATVAAGGATLMASGPDEWYARALPLLQAITTNIYHCGDRVGDGQATKTVNNAMFESCRLGALELAALGRKAGVPLDRLIEALSRGESRSFGTEKVLPAIWDGQPSTNFALALMLKDVDQAVSLGMALGVPMPVTNGAQMLLQMGVNTLGDKARLDDMIGVVDSLSAVHLGDGSTPTASEEPAGVVDLIDGAVSALNRLISCECLALGLAYGLTLERLGPVLRKSSGWNGAAEAALSLLAADPSGGGTHMASVLQKLQGAAALAMRSGAPALLARIGCGAIEAGLNATGGVPRTEGLRPRHQLIAAAQSIAATS
ncbi:NAD(P)-dependent oxidoreductase [Variovorax rhizosphaerae]|uniref:NAD(P)-dependent oxidoreductase n=1 Tax=Variovorax rhizosphaerae TaxID=1836200 RepID=A0ABU8WTE1_9BURK